MEAIGTLICLVALVAVAAVVISVARLGLNGTFGSTSPYFTTPSRPEITRQATDEVHNIAADGRRAMDRESERFLREEYDRYTGNRNATNN